MNRRIEHSKCICKVRLKPADLPNLLRIKPLEDYIRVAAKYLNIHNARYRHVSNMPYVRFLVHVYLLTDLNNQFSEVMPFQHADKSPWSIFNAFNNILSIFDFAASHSILYLRKKIWVVI